ncbi:MAG: DUF4147 domain-containing protein [Deltaproteobacteria bacterium]|nr:MAG: DUF4147 domain-containing protein [Deltaproteobacteria bacterium]
MGMNPSVARSWLLDLWESALSRVQSDLLVERALRSKPQLWNPEPGGRSVVVALGKAAAAMAEGAQRVVGDRLSEGWMITKDGHAKTIPGWTTLEARHPVPDERSAKAGHLMLELAKGLGEDDRWLLLLSGGASSLCIAPVPGLGWEDIATAGQLLLQAGATIQEINSVRKHLSLLKGGGLRRALSPASGWTLSLSDVPGDHPDAIGSGPTVPDPTTFEDALTVLQRYQLTAQLPSIVRILEEGKVGRRPETLKPNETVAGSMPYDCLMSNLDLQRVLREEAESTSHVPIRDLGSLSVSVEELVHRVVERIKQGSPSKDGVLWVGGGEPTLAVTGPGQGGRLQHLALHVAEQMAQRSGWCMLAVGSDGTDGPTDVAGALVDGETLSRVNARGGDVEGMKVSFDSYQFHQWAQSFVRTGPTGTHVGDIVLLLVQSSGAFA